MKSLWRSAGLPGMLSLNLTIRFDIPSLDAATAMLKKGGMIAPNKPLE